MRLALVLSTLALFGCPDKGDGGSAASAGPLMNAVDQTLPTAVVERPYEEQVLATAGTPPYTWSVPEWQELPGGLSLQPDGKLVGVPSQAGTFTFQVEVIDAAGRQKRPWVTLAVALEPVVVACGETASGRFASSGYAGADPDFDDFGGHEWIAVDLPHDATTRVELVFDLDAPATAYVGKPSETLGSWDVEEHYELRLLDPATGSLTVTVDPSTDPSLAGFSNQELLSVLAVAQAAGDWSVEVVCTDGPVFRVVPQYPTELGEPIQIDFDVYDAPGTRIFTDDPLPDWMLWDEATGVVSGTAEEVGSWPITVVAEAPDGRRREERSIIGVYEVHDLACGDQRSESVLEGYFDGEFTAYYDVNGFDVFRVPLNPDTPPSAVALQVSGLDSVLLGTAEADPGWLKFYPGAERIYASYYDASFSLDPRTYPAIKHYLEPGELYFQVAPTGSARDYVVSVDCDDTPRPNLAGLPYVPLFDPVDEVLAAIGGEAPYSWGVTGLAPGLQATTEGGLFGSTGEAGEFDVTLRVEDKGGASGSDRYPLYVGAEDACRGEVPVECGDTLAGTFATSYFGDPNFSDRSTLRLCLLPEGVGSVGFTVEAMDSELRVDIVDPGRTSDEMLFEGKGTYVRYVDRWDVEGVGLNPFSFPNVLDYRGMPIRAVVRAYDEGDYRVVVECE